VNTPTGFRRSHLKTSRHAVVVSSADLTSLSPQEMPGRTDARAREKSFVFASPFRPPNLQEPCQTGTFSACSTISTAYIHPPVFPATRSCQNSARSAEKRLVRLRRIEFFSRPDGFADRRLEDKSSEIKGAWKLHATIYFSFGLCGKLFASSTVEIRFARSGVGRRLRLPGRHSLLRAIAATAAVCGRPYVFRLGAARSSCHERLRCHAGICAPRRVP